MKRYINAVFIMSVVFIIGVILLIVITKDSGVGSDNKSREQIVLLNKIAKRAEENVDNLTQLDAEDFEFGFVIIDKTNNVLYSHIEDSAILNDISVENAVQNRYPYMFLKKGDSVWGTVIMIDDGMDEFRILRTRFIVGTCICCLLILIAASCYGIYIRNAIIVPFRKMKDFAAKVAQGELDEPLEMDREKMFGAFTESFDIMREELAESRKRELELQRKEKELVASLSHDLKTPVTGIKVTSEFIEMRLRIKLDSKEEADVSFSKEEIADMLEDTSGIYQKTEQIDTLVSDLFTSTLDDLGEFRVNSTDEESEVLLGIVHSFDNKDRVIMSNIPAVIINVDKKRMAQVIGNVIANSYKYADTVIDISYELVDGFLEMSIRDHGPGVPANELDLITNKFYRGKDWENTDKEGNGMGLYIAKSLMQKMSGDLIAESDGDGLLIKLIIPLS
ncbi:MAG: HAMP domain-containing histidine kinase [Eubacterium sp.]|nr:HAMP domain-containing histidine kinase [Eubacterium sp.]